MSFAHHPPSGPSFDQYTVTQPQQLQPLPPTPFQGTVQPPMQQDAFPQHQVQTDMQQQSLPSQQPQPPQYIPPLQGTTPAPQFIQPPQAQLQQNQFTHQQMHQVQQVIENMPSEKLQMLQQQAQQMMPPPPYTMSPMQPPPQQPSLQPVQPLPQQQSQGSNFTVTAPAGLFGSKKNSAHGSGPQDAQKSDSVKRFFGDTLFGRVARSSVQTVTSMAKIPTSLSPWGDNNPVTLPNVRYRDAVLFTTFAFVGGPLVEGAADSVTSTFGADSFISEVVNAGAGAIAASTIVKYSVFQIVEQAIDKGILEHMLPEEEKMIQTTHVKSLQVGIKHKLMGVDADLRFVGVYPSTNPQACEKGWFCPYLFASARTPSIPRVNDFAIAQFFGPFLGGDYLLAHTLLSSCTSVLSLCDPTPTTDLRTNRILVLFTCITPYRSNLWSTSRRPGCGTLRFHLFNGCPALVLPVKSSAPITAWSPWTLSQMHNKTSGYSPEWQHEQICEYLDTIISLEHVEPLLRERYVGVLGRAVSLVINSALALEGCKKLLKELDPERAGIIMLRY